MGSRRRHLPGTLSELVAQNVRRIAGEKSLATADLIERAGFKPNYYYVRMRLELGFSLSDLEALARTLEVAPDVLLQPSDGKHHPLRIDGNELGHRLKLLLRTYGRDATVDRVVDGVRKTVPDFTAQSWASLVEADGPVEVEAAVLNAIAGHFRVGTGYLTELVIDDAVEQVKAELELQDALRDSGAMVLAARSLGEASPTVLRAIAAAIRTRPGNDPLRPRKNQP